MWWLLRPGEVSFRNAASPSGVSQEREMIWNSVHHAHFWNGDEAWDTGWLFSVGLPWLHLLGAWLDSSLFFPPPAPATTRPLKSETERKGLSCSGRLAWEGSAIQIRKRTLKQKVNMLILLIILSIYILKVWVEVCTYQALNRFYDPSPSQGRFIRSRESSLQIGEKFSTSGCSIFKLEYLHNR